MNVERAIEQLAQSVRNLDARLRDVANFRPKLQAWQPLPLLSPWVHFGGGSLAPSYWKDTDGNVHLQGWMEGGNSGAFVWDQLPEGYRPGVELAFTCIDVNNATPSVILAVGDDGESFVAVSTDPTPGFSIDGIHWRAAA